MLAGRTLHAAILQRGPESDLEGRVPPPQSEDNAMVRQTTTPKKDLGSGTNKPPKPDEGKDKDTERPDQPQRDERKGREDNC